MRSLELKGCDLATSTSGLFGLTLPVIDERKTVRIHINHDLVVRIQPLRLSRYDGVSTDFGESDERETKVEAREICQQEGETGSAGPADENQRLIQEVEVWEAKCSCRSLRGLGGRDSSWTKEDHEAPR